MVEMPTENEPVKVVCGDALEVLRTLPDGCVDAVITDPPYNVGLEYDGDETGDARPGYAEWCAEWFAELKRACRGPILISCGVANLGVWHAIEPPRWVMCWWKPASSGRCVVGFNNWEPILVYGRPPRNVCDVIRTTEQAALPVEHKRQAIAHPCPKPVEWARELIRRTTADLILDPFAGSGTTGIAAALEGRRAVLIEKEPLYVNITGRRVAKVMAKSGLFAGVPA
jgi:site-specific DNA-methyltransferase (adenine-specific)